MPKGDRWEGGGVGIYWPHFKRGHRAGFPDSSPGADSFLEDALASFLDAKISLSTIKPQKNMEKRRATHTPTGGSPVSHALHILILPAEKAQSIPALQTWSCCQLIPGVANVPESPAQDRGPLINIHKTQKRNISITPKELESTRSVICAQLMQLASCGMWGPSWGCAREQRQKIL